MKATGFDFGHEPNAQIHSVKDLMFDLAALESELAGTLFAGKLHFSRVTGSTNTDALGRRAPRRAARLGLLRR